MRLDEIINRFEKVRKIGEKSYQCLCKSHPDKKESLTITEKDNKILIHCHAGCTTQQVLSSIGLTEKDLFNDKQQKSQIEAEYIYRDENNNPLYKVIRFEPKNFVQAKYNNGEWIFKMTEARYVLYNLPNIIKSDIIYFVEGEKDADNLNKIGLVATTSIGGASGFNKHALEYSKCLKDKIIYIIPDNDNAGYKYAEDIKNALKGIAAEIKILKLKNEIKNIKEKSDISDVLEKYGKEETLKILTNLINKDYKDDVFPISTAGELNADNFSKILDFLGIKIKFNIITKRISIEGLPEMYAKSDFFEILPIYIKDVLINHGIRVNTNIIGEYILLEISKNNFNPFVDFLRSNKWDGRDRINELFDIFYIEKEFYKTLFRKWLHQTVSMAFNTLEKPYGIDGVLTLQGKQGIGKTYALSLLSPNPEWFQDGLTIDVNNKDSLIRSTSALISEIGEFDSTMKKEQSALKAFLTSPVDEIRPPYGKKSIRRARTTSFCATVNPDSFLKDESGNRRFWIIPVEKIDYERLKNYGKEFIMQLWLQVYDEVKDNFQKFRLTREEREKLDKNNLAFTEFLPCEEEILQLFDFKSKERQIWTNQDLIKEFEFNISPQMLGKTINKIKNSYPDLVEIKRKNTGNIYYLPIKKKNKKV